MKNDYIDVVFTIRLHVGYENYKSNFRIYGPLHTFIKVV